MSLLHRRKAFRGSWWSIAGQTCVAAYRASSAASLAASYVNLVNPGTNDAAPGVAPTWAAATGWTFDGSTQYLTTGVIGTIAPQWSLFVQFAAFSAGAYKTSAGVFDNVGASNQRAYLAIANNAAGGIRSYIAATFADNPGAIAAGNYGIAGGVAYRNGIAEPNGVTSALYGPTNNPIFIGALCNNGSPADYASIQILAVAIYSTGLAPANVATLAAVMAAL